MNMHPRHVRHWVPGTTIFGHPPALISLVGTSPILSRVCDAIASYSPPKHAVPELRFARSFRVGAGESKGEGS